MVRPYLSIICPDRRRKATGQPSIPTYLPPALRSLRVTRLCPQVLVPATINRIQPRVCTASAARAVSNMRVDGRRLEAMEVLEGRRRGAILSRLSPG